FRLANVVAVGCSALRAVVCSAASGATMNAIVATAPIIILVNISSPPSRSEFWLIVVPFRKKRNAKRMPGNVANAVENDCGDYRNQTGYDVFRACGDSGFRPAISTAAQNFMFGPAICSYTELAGQSSSADVAQKDSWCVDNLSGQLFG
ncbi:MAG: hypothetical protein KDA47_03045, partial [Planctomycetales bacterium]|nr:hypothetical protein [Planctomycetales bacterium]